MPASPKSEPRSLTARGAATRSRIVEAAADLIYAHGVERTSLDDVRAATGVSKSQLYHYFVDKDALVLEVIARQTERVIDAQRPHLEALESLPALKAWRNVILRLNKAAQERAQSEPLFARSCVERHNRWPYRARVPAGDLNGSSWPEGARPRPRRGVRAPGRADRPRR